MIKKIHWKFLWIFVFILSTASVTIYLFGRDNSDADTCLVCHSKLTNLNKKFLHPLVKEGKCLSCHVSYDLAAHKETAKPVLETCLICHTQDKLGRTHPVGQGIIDSNTGSMMTCTSSCHLIHGSDYRYQLPLANTMDLCLSCHKNF